MYNVVKKFTFPISSADRVGKLLLLDGKNVFVMEKTAPAKIVLPAKLFFCHKGWKKSQSKVFHANFVCLLTSWQRIHTILLLLVRVRALNHLEPSTRQGLMQCYVN